MSRERILAERATSTRGVARPTIVCAGSGFFYVRLPGRAALVGAWDRHDGTRRAFPLTFEEALVRVAQYYESCEERKRHFNSLGFGALGA